VAQLFLLGGTTHMKRIYIFLIGLSALAIGGIAGFYFAGHRYAHTVVYLISSYEFGRAADTFNTLRDLRAGETNRVFDALESDLDWSVISLRGILDDYPAVEHAPDYTNLVRRIADYRAVYPHRDDNTNMDASVIQVLTAIKKESH
jgi:hypothetical protein